MYRFFYYTLDQLTYFFAIPFLLIVLGRCIDAGISTRFTLLFSIILFISPDLIYHTYFYLLIIFWLLPTQIPIHFMDKAFQNYFNKMESMTKKLKEQEAKLRNLKKEEKLHNQQPSSEYSKKETTDLSIKTLKDCFAILEVDADARSEEIKISYKRKMTQYHPDKVANLGPKLKEIAEKESRKINLAYEFLEKNGRI